MKKLLSGYGKAIWPLSSLLSTRFLKRKNHFHRSRLHDLEGGLKTWLQTESAAIALYVIVLVVLFLIVSEMSYQDAISGVGL